MTFLQALRAVRSSSFTHKYGSRCEYARSIGDTIWCGVMDHQLCEFCAASMLERIFDKSSLEFDKDTPPMQECFGYFSVLCKWCWTCGKGPKCANESHSVLVATYGFAPKHIAEIIRSANRRPRPDNAKYQF